MMRAILVALLVLAPVPASALDLDEAFALARVHDPDLRLQEELALQARLARLRILTYVSPTLEVRGNYTWNDPVVAFDPGEGGGAIQDALEQQFGLLAFTYVKLINEGLMGALDCQIAAGIFGFKDVQDCGDLTAAIAALQDEEPPQDGETEPIVITPRHQLSYSVNVGWLLSPRLGSQLKTAGALRDVGLARVEHNLSLLRFGIYQTYAALYRAQEEERLAREAVELAQQHLEMEQARFDVGSVDETAVLRQRAELLGAQQAAEMAHAGLARARRMLAQRIGVDAEDLVVEEPPRLIDRWGGDDALDDATDLVDSAMDRRLDLRANQLDLKLAKLANNDVNMQWLPNIFLGLSYSDGRGIQDGEVLVPGFSDRSATWRLSVQAVWNLWDGGLRIVDGREAASRRRAASYLVEQAQARVRDDVLSGIDDLRAALRSSQAAKAQLDVARRLLELVEQRVLLGSANDLELAEARLGYQQARVNELSMRLGIDEAAWRLELALGLR
jgi:OMF family outer membrane factor